MKCYRCGEWDGEKCQCKDGQTIFHGDCREIFPELPKVDAVITDPPYGMNWDYSGQGSGKKTQGGKQSRFKKTRIRGDDREFDPSWLTAFPKSVIWGMQHYPNKLMKGSVLVWVKKYPDAFGTFLSDADLAWIKGGHGVYCSPVINPASFQSERMHPTQKPIELMLWCILKAKISEDETVLDPYLGSGTTLRACKDLGRRGIGIEIEEKYCEIAAGRLRQGVLL
jgi:DNA modification methylase